MASLVTTNELRTSRGLPLDGADEARLQQQLDWASAEVRRYLSRDISQHTYPAAPTDGIGDFGMYDGPGRRLLRLRQYPVSGTVRVWVDATGRFGDNPDGAFASATELVFGTDFAVKWDGCLPGTATKCSYCGLLERVGLVWPGRLAHQGGLTTGYVPGSGNIKVTYTAGFATIPGDIQQAVCMLAGWIGRSTERGGAITSESLGGYSYSIASGTSAEFGDIRRVLSRWRAPSV